MASVNFDSAEQFAEWLDSLHATLEDGSVICNRKWEPAQRALAAVMEWQAEQQAA